MKRVGLSQHVEWKGKGSWVQIQTWLIVPYRLPEVT